MQKKIKPIHEIGRIVSEEKGKGKKVAHCHGVFDLLHPGHIRHLKEAKKHGDKLVVSITPDRFVNKGPGRPAFNEKLRLEQLASLVFVDYVVLNDAPDAVSIIKTIKPSLYVKGAEYREHDKDVTGKISEEEEAVTSIGGQVFYTDDIVFSSSSLINQYFDADAERIAPFIRSLKNRYTLDTVLEKLESFADMNVLVVGDAIIDEYQYVHPLGQSGKGVHLTARLLEKETFLGGSLIIANHLASFAKSVTLVTAVGENCPNLSFIQENLHEKVKAQFIPFEGFPTLTKKRYVLKDGNSLTKLFETYSSNDRLLGRQQVESVIGFLKAHSEDYDLVLTCDFGNGFTNPLLIETLCSLPVFLAVNTQTNSGNRGYNVVTHYHRADFISLNEPELRLAAHDRYSRLESVVKDIADILECPNISITQGVDGISFFAAGEVIKIPAMTMRAIDRVGAGDSYFALASLCMAKGYDPLLAGFLGSIAAAIDVQIIGNKEAIKKVELCKYVTRLMK